jgi:hypothetical protein
LAAVQQYGGELEYVPENLITPEMCLAAVQQDWRALHYVPEEFKPQVRAKMLGSWLLAPN